jgi:hypothetical protein
MRGKNERSSIFQKEMLFLKKMTIEWKKLENSLGCMSIYHSYISFLSRDRKKDNSPIPGTDLPIRGRSKFGPTRSKARLGKEKEGIAVH